MNRKTLERKADSLHELWTHWYLQQRYNSTPKNLERWEIQAKTQYKDLSEEDKQKDRDLILSYNL